MNKSEQTGEDFYADCWQTTLKVNEANHWIY